MWSDPSLWYEWIKVGAFIAGLAVGAVAVFSPSWVWLRKQVISNAAVWLATLGTAMVTMSIWQSVQIEGAGFKASITGLQARFDALDNATADLARDIDSVQQALARQRASTEQQFDVGWNRIQEVINTRKTPEGYEEYLSARPMRPISEMPPGLERTRNIVAHMLASCESVLGVDPKDVADWVRLANATTEEETWKVLENCTERLKRYEKP